MNKKLVITSLTLLFTSAVSICGQSRFELNAHEVAQQMGVGWNLGNTMEANVPSLKAETSWQDTPTTPALIKFVKAQGFKSVRIPASWHCHLDKGTTNINDEWMARVQEIVDYCIHDSLYVVLNSHWDGGWLEDSFDNVSDENVSAKSDTLQAIWTQIADRFKGYDEHLLFAGLNEPSHGYNNGKFTDRMMLALLQYEQVFIDAVRKTGGNNLKRILVIQGPSTNIDETCKPVYASQLPDDVDPNRLMVEVHYYDPWNFCGMEKDESWGEMAYYWGKDNHVNSSKRNAKWGEEDHLKKQFKSMKENFVDRGYPVILGEFSANWRQLKGEQGESQQAHDASIYQYFKDVTHEALKNGLVPMVWDINHTDFPTMTVIDRKTLKVFCTPAMNGIRKGQEE